MSMAAERQPAGTRIARCLCQPDVHAVIGAKGVDLSICQQDKEELVSFITRKLNERDQAIKRLQDEVCAMFALT